MVNKDGSEIIPYDEEGIPIYIKERFLSDYPDYRALCHWHEDVEFIHVLEGQMNYYINGKDILLKPGDTVMINSGRLHYGYSDKRQECRFYCVIFHPGLIVSNKKLSKKYVESVVLGDRPDYLMFGREEKVGEVLREVFAQKKELSTAYELEAVALFQKLWRIVFDRMLGEALEVLSESDPDLLSQRRMVSYIYQNYAGGITLEEIAEAGNVCRSKCCKIFKKYVGQSPMDFVNSYRLERSRRMLDGTDTSITEICTQCGFNHLSYFSRQFRLTFGCTPRDYRKRAVTVL